MNTANTPLTKFTKNAAKTRQKTSTCFESQTIVKNLQNVCLAKFYSKCGHKISSLKQKIVIIKLSNEYSTKLDSL